MLCPCCKKGGLDIYGDHATIVIVCAGHHDCSLEHNVVRDRMAMTAQDGQAISVEYREAGCS